MSYTLLYTKRAAKDVKLLRQSNLYKRAVKILHVLADNPFQEPPSYESLKGKMTGAYSRRINKQHRIVYEVFEDQKIVRIIRLWTHYE